MNNDTMKRHTLTYLYADGHAVCLFEKNDKQAGLIEWAEVWEKWTEADCRFEGRIIIGRYSEGLAALCKSAKAIRAKAPTVDAGSEGTRAKGILFGTLEVQTKAGSLYFHDMPGTISGPYTYQPDAVENFDAGLARWGNVRVGAIHRVKAGAPAMAVA